MARASAMLLATALLAACGGGSEVAVSPGRSRRLDLVPADAAPPQASERLLRYQIFGERPDWALMAGRSEVARVDIGQGDPVNALILSGPVGEERALELRVGGEFDPREIDRLAVGLVFHGTLRVRASLLRGSQAVAEGSAEGLGREGAIPIEVRFAPPADLEPCDQLAVRFEGLERVGVFSLELFRDPSGAVLPPLGAPELVEIDGEQRLAAGLASGRAAETRFTVEPGHVLSIGYGLPDACRGPLPPIEIELELRGSEGLSHTYGLSFEHDLVVVYSEHDPAFVKERAIRNALKKVHPNNRDTYRQTLEAQYRQRQDTRAAFGQAPSQQKEKEKLDPADVPTGLIGGWLERAIDLESFVGQEVIARFELIPVSGEEALCALANPVLLGTEREAPCVLLVTSDAHRADHLSAAGVHGAIETPWIDQWTRRGTLFTNAWSSSNAPLEALAAIFSGSPARPGTSAGAATLAERFAAAGWTTIAVVSSTDVGSAAGAPLLAGFERVIAPDGRDFTAAQAVDALVKRLPDLEHQSLFAWLQLSDARAPYDPPQDFRRMHYPEGADPSKPGDSPGAIPAWAEDIADAGYVEALYAGEVTWLDRRLRPLVEHQRLATRAWVAFAGTCGESLGTFDHADLSAETLRVPLFLAGPGLGGRPVARDVATCDLGRTLLDRAGLEASAFPGRSLVGRSAEASGGATEAPDRGTTVFARAASGAEAAVARGEYLLELALGADGAPVGPARLHDVEIDAGCAVDISEAEPELARELEGLLRAWLAESIERRTDP